MPSPSECPPALSNPTTTAKIVAVKRTIVSMVRHAAPTLIEASVIPLLLMCVLTTMFTLWVGIWATLGWTVVCIAARFLSRRPVSGMLMVTLLVISSRTVITAAVGDVKLYFYQPLITTALIALVLLVTACTHKPFIGRIIKDLLPLPANHFASAAGLKTLRILSVVWAAEYVGNIFLNLALMSRFAPETYVLVRSPAGWVLAGVALLISLQVLRPHLPAIIAASEPTPTFKVTTELTADTFTSFELDADEDVPAQRLHEETVAKTPSLPKL